MDKINLVKNLSEKNLQEMGVFKWAIWSKEASEFPWSYEEQETCYFLEGDVIVTTNQGDSVHIGKGDLVTFPKGLSCTWNIIENVKKHYNFG